MRRYLDPHVYYNSGYGYLESSWGYLESLPGVIFALRNGAVSKSKWRTMVRITGSSQVVIWFRPGFAFSSHVTLGVSRLLSEPEFIYLHGKYEIDHLEGL